MEKNIFHPQIFGPKMWSVLHTAASAYPVYPKENEIEEMKYFIIGLPAAIPCVKCKTDTRNFINTFSSNYMFTNRETLFAFTVELHNYVNRKLGKPELSMDSAKKLWGFA